MRPVPPVALALLLLGGGPPFRAASGAVVDEALRARIDAEAEAATAAIEAAARLSDLEDFERERRADDVAAFLAAQEGVEGPAVVDSVGAGDEEEDEVEVDHRRLRELMAGKMHYPLPCNAGVEQLEGSDCLPLSSLVASHDDGSGPLTIPCGACAVCDVEDGSTLEVPSGVRVEGKLLFPASANATLFTTNVLVLGLLVMRPPGDGRKVTVRLHGEEDLYFHPHPSMPNQDACPDEGCKVGTKVIAVAGGRVDVRGGDYHGGCPSWEKIRDVGRMDSAAPSLAPSGFPTAPPTDVPSAFPSAAPTGFPSAPPSASPVTAAPTPAVLALCDAGAVLPGGSFAGEDVAAAEAASPWSPEGPGTELELVDCGDRFSTTTTTTTTTTSTTTAATTAATSSGPAVISARYEAEVQQMDSTSYAKTSNSGYTGSGYVDMGKLGSYVKFVDVDGGATGGTCTLAFRYANKGSVDRPLSVAINGDVAGTLAFPSTGSWTNWQTDTIVTTCPAGSIELLLTATDENGPNLDGLDYDLVAAATTTTTGATTSGPASVVTHYEAEDQLMDGTTYAKTSNPGYGGSGYADMGGLGSYVKFVDVDGGASGGTCTLAFRYANGGTSDRPLSVAVNGVVVGTLAFPITGWTDWQTETIEVASCPAGSIEVLLTATSDNGPNLDSLDVTLVAAAADDDDDDGTGGPPADCALRVRRRYWPYAPSAEASPLAQTCFAATAGRKWRLSYDVKFSDDATGAALPCTSSIRCPFARVHVWDAAGEHTIDDLFADNDWAGGWRTEAADGQGVPWNHYERVVDVPARWTDAERIRVDLAGGPDTWTVAEYDNVEFVPLAPTPAPTSPPLADCRGELVRGGAFADDTYAPFFPWDGASRASLSLVDCDAGGDCALKTDKDHWFQGPVVEVPVDCLREVGSKWRLQFDAKMLDQGGAAVGCASPGHLCPMVRVWVYDGEGGETIENIIVADWPGGWKMPDGDGDDVPFNRFDAILEAKANWATATKIELHFDGGPDGRHSTIIDNVSMAQPPPVPIPPTSPPTDLTFDVDCSVGLIANGAIRGTTAPYATTHSFVDLSLVDCNGDDCALRAEDLVDWYVGALQAVPPRCFTTERQDWLVQFDVQLLDSVGNTLPCDEGLLRCPMLRVRSVDSEGIERYDQHYDADGWAVWTMAPGGWNRFNKTIPTQEYYIGAQEITFQFVGGPAAQHVLVVDNVMVEPLPLAPTMAPLPLPPDQIYVSPKAAECWGPGAELLITTNTDYSHEYQVVAVHSADPDTGVLTLAEDLELPGGAPLSTLANDPRQAVEVARLDRSIVFEAVSDEGDDLIGGHVIFYHTPGIKQHLEGVEIRNFGQAGRLGRYPVHFHMCEDAAESIVKRTVVRQSNQRCYVIHGSQNVTLEENVAFDTFGHCYMNEDGSEHSNRFIRNLGAHTKKARRLIDTEREETDDVPGTFWIVNMQNHFEGNVVAGSESYGWFVEGHRKIRGPSIYQDPDLNPMLTVPTLFKDNIIHSTAAYGMTTYPRGWTPTTTAVLENMMVYRGLTRGMFIHHSGKLHWKGGYFLNHRKSAIEMDGADELTVEGLTIVDRTASEREAHCKGSDRKGIIIHPVKQNHMNMTIRGTTLIDVDMMEWGKNRCEHMRGHPLQLGDGLFVYRPIWDIPTLFDNVLLDLENQPQDLAETFAIDGCLSAEEKGMKDVAIEVTNDNQRIFSAEGADGFVVSPSIATLLDPAACAHLPGTTAASTSANYEAEDQQWDISSHAKTSNPGYSGNGYIDMGSTGSFVKFTDVDGTTGGTCTLTIRYANQNSEDRPLSVAVNGYVIGTLAFPSTGSWSTWQTETIETTCLQSNEIVLTATGANGPNLDSLDYAVSEVPGCLKFCPGTCLRTILFHTDVTTEYNMVVRDSYNAQRQHYFPSQVKMGTTFTYSPNYYGVSLPEGSFDISFHKKDTDELGWPSFVAPVFLNAPLSCDYYATETTFNIIQPPPTRSACGNLIRGGDFNTEETVADWLVISTDIEWSGTGGVDGSGALTYNHKSIVSGVSQWIDTSCLVAGGVYEFSASYRVIDAATGMNRDQTQCAGSHSVYCMHVWIEFRENDNSVMGDTWHGARQTVARVVEPLIEAGSTNFGSVKGTWTVTEDQASDRANRAVLHVNNVRDGGTVILDQVSFNRV